MAPFICQWPLLLSHYVSEDGNLIQLLSCSIQRTPLLSSGTFILMDVTVTNVLWGFIFVMVTRCSLRPLIFVICFCHLHSHNVPEVHFRKDRFYLQSENVSPSNIASIKTLVTVCSIISETILFVIFTV